jgi:hypothetical protein
MSPGLYMIYPHTIEIFGPGDQTPRAIIEKERGKESPAWIAWSVLHDLYGARRDQEGFVNMETAGGQFKWREHDARHIVEMAALFDEGDIARALLDSTRTMTRHRGGPKDWMPPMLGAVRRESGLEMTFDFDVFRVVVQPQGAAYDRYYFMVVVESPEGHATSLILDGPIRLDPTGRSDAGPPNREDFAGAAWKVVNDLLQLLRLGVDAYVKESMRAERRFLKRDVEERHQMAEEQFPHAQAIGEQALAAAEESLRKEFEMPRPAFRRRGT